MTDAPARHEIARRFFPFSATNNLVTLTGASPYALRRLRVNGEVFEPVWSSATAWSILLALAAGASALTIEGIDAVGNPVTNAPVSTTVTVNAVLEPVGQGRHRRG